MTVRLSTAVLVVAALLAVAFTVVQARDLHGVRQADDDREAALEVATTEVSELVTLTPANLDDRLESLDGRLTERFSQQFQAMYTTFAEVVEKNGVASDGRVVATGLVSATSRKAVALVAARATVTGPEQDDPVRRSYRFEVTLTHQGDRWLVSGMRFVA